MGDRKISRRVGSQGGIFAWIAYSAPIPPVFDPFIWKGIPRFSTDTAEFSITDFDSIEIGLIHV